MISLEYSKMACPPEVISILNIEFLLLFLRRLFSLLPDSSHTGYTLDPQVWSDFCCVYGGTATSIFGDAY